MTKLEIQYRTCRKLRHYSNIILDALQLWMERKRATCLIRITERQHDKSLKDCVMFCNEKGAMFFTHYRPQKVCACCGNPPVFEERAYTYNMNVYKLVHAGM